VNTNDPSKRRLLKLAVAAGIIAPGLSSWLSFDDLCRGWYGLRQRAFMNAVPQRNQAVCSRDEEHSTVLSLEGEHRDLLSINHTAAYIWNLCDGKNCVRDMVRAMSAQFKIPMAQCRKDVAFVVQALQHHGVIQV